MAYGNATPKRLAIGQLLAAATSATLYTVPTGMGAVIKRIPIWVTVGNLSVSSTITLSINGSPVSFVIAVTETNNSQAGYYRFKQWADFDLNIALNAGDVVTLTSNANVTIAFTISGVEFTV